ncbi:Hypothetical protein DEACI_3046 [Acididesulfobacillus acetoxydans]|uniref:ECF transporter S component n=1 Tax=Acididesulfobacillus acetoxydans TaxID=1561005 RepID=A0A8S0WH16_9FIRM|nr:hypothetical protein [Acididesulfobacillus acetoxydans]CAA7602372.1 Hypothetical protein DEACI_3046 [Acididesulfobacillus acetoxydans]CEJ08393.1 Hypothetical protein DEACI_2869 [Acididesulfobacillus acetoxydans]
MSGVGRQADTLVNKRMYDTTKAAEVFQYLFLALLGVSIPLLLQHPQLLVGSVVNFVLIMTAVTMKGWGEVASLVILPSLAALLGTYLFGPFQFVLLYMIPFIWIGNAILVFAFKYLYVGKRVYFLATLLAAALLKAGFLFTMAMVLIKLAVIPAAAAPVFAVGMGLVQLETALLGGCLGAMVSGAYKFLSKKQAAKK